MRRLAAILALLGILALGSGAAGYAHHAEHLPKIHEESAGHAEHGSAPSAPHPTPAPDHTDCAVCAHLHAPSATVTPDDAVRDEPLCAGSPVPPARLFLPWRHAPTSDSRGPPAGAAHT